ncbi:MAG: hypothetical protein WDO68_00310 [Gammaproteobacteria bacterium]
MERVEEPQLDVPMRVERRRLPVPHFGRAVVFQQRRDVVEDDAHFHAAIRRVDDVLHQQLAGVVFPPEVVGEVEGVLGRVHHRQAPAKGVLVRIEHAPGGAVDTEFRVKRVFEIGEGAAGLGWRSVAHRSAWQVVWQCGAARDPEHQNDRENPAAQGGRVGFVR